jgi:hypothetical protein
MSERLRTMTDEELGAALATLDFPFRAPSGSC